MWQGRRLQRAHNVVHKRFTLRRATHAGVDIEPLCIAIGVCLTPHMCMCHVAVR